MARLTFSRFKKRSRFLLERWRNRNSRLPPLLFLGDSHVDYFTLAAQRGWLGARHYDACAVAGATAVGLRNPNAKTNAVTIFDDFLARVRRDAIVILHLGEVDCGFVIWYRAEKYRDGVDRQLAESIDAYFAFVDRAMTRGHANFIVTGASVPTIADGQDWGEVANARREVAATLRQRTELTLRYNRALREEAARRGLPYIDICDEALDAATGVVRSDLLNSNRLDHHMDKDRAAALWARKLNAVLARDTGAASDTARRVQGARASSAS